jgi:flagellin
MPLVINTNVASLNAQRNLNNSQDALQTALERLSTGLRINSAKDDAAGLAIAERFTAQIRGLNQATRNANDGISFAQTAEGALGTIGNALQRIRELAVQSANDTNSASDRQAINNEVASLISEVNRIASSTQFNGQNVLDGTSSELFFQVGANAGQTIGVSGVDSRGSQLGAVTTEVADVDAVELEAGAAGSVTTADLGFDYSAGNITGTVTVGGEALTIDVDASANGASDVAAAIQAEIDGNANLSDITVTGAADGTLTFENATLNDVSIAFALEDGTGTADNTVTGTGTLTDGSGTPTTASLDISSLDLTGGVTIDISGTQSTIAAGSDGDALAAAVQSAFGNANLSVTYDSANNELDFSNTGSTTVDLGTLTITDNAGTPGTTFTDTVTAPASEAVTIGSSFGDGETLTFDATVDGVSFQFDASSLEDVVSQLNARSAETNVTASLNSEGDSIRFSSESGNSFDVSLTTDVAGTAVDVATASADATADFSTINGVSVETREAATNALTVVDFALQRVNGLRAELGAVQTRFESTISNLGITAENLSAARSRIQDADFAAETAALTRAQILQQAGTSVLAQANAIPQNVLSLLQ